MPGFIELKDVRKIYRMGEVEIKAVDGINFSIERGEFVVIVGPSGAGKTTVLNILGGMDQATSGEVWVNDNNIAESILRAVGEQDCDGIVLGSRGMGVLEGLFRNSVSSVIAENADVPVTIVK